MGYSVPGADFTESDKLQVNVGATLGAVTANVLTSFTKAWQANAVKTEKLKQLQGDLTDRVTIANKLQLNKQFKLVLILVSLKKELQYLNNGQNK